MIKNPSKSEHKSQQIIPTRSSYLIRASKLYLLAADAINNTRMIKEKVEYYQKATQFYFMGNHQINISAINCNYDVYSALLKLSPYLSKLLIKTTADKLEYIRLSAIRGMEFLIEYLGCSLGDILPQYLQIIISSFPSSYQDQAPLDISQNSSRLQDKEQLHMSNEKAYGQR